MNKKTTNGKKLQLAHEMDKELHIGENYIWHMKWTRKLQMEENYSWHKN
jgi:hypothetical protein